MKALKTKKIQGCLEGSNVKDILLSDEIDMPFVEKLSSLGKPVVNDKMKKPFFRVIVRGKYTIKGSVGNSSIRVIMPKEDKPGDFEELVEFINS